MVKKKFESVIGTDVALTMARKILTEFYGSESFDNVHIQQKIVANHGDDPYCILKIESTWFTAGQISLIEKIMNEYPKATFEIEENTIKIFAVNDEEEGDA
jgi:hypothetical protein